MADKNAGITLMPKHWYVQKAKEHLKTPDTYTENKSSFFNPEAKILLELAELCKKNKRDPLKWFDSKKCKIVVPEFYIMPKIHKTPIGVRPIIPSHSWYTTPSAKWLHQQLLPIVKKYNQVVMDRLGLIQDLENKTFKGLNKKPYLATIDVSALYTSIDLNKGLEIIRRVIKNSKLIKPSSIDFMIDLLNWVLRNNYFRFNGTFYQQIKGAAMGGNVSGVFADIVLAAMECYLLKELPQDQQPLYYKRYRDDILLITKSEKNAKAVEEILNKPQFLQFNLEQLGTTVNYLDLTLFFGEKWRTQQKIDIKPYTKPTNTGLYTHYATYKPEFTKNSWITGESIRLLRAAQHPKAYNKNINKLKKNLTKAEYPKKVIRSQLKYSFEDRNWLIEKQPEMDSQFYSIKTGRMAHEKWNFIQNNFKPLLKTANVQITAASGKTTLDAINSVSKKMLNVVTYRNKIYNHVKKRKGNKTTEVATNTHITGKIGDDPSIMRKRDHTGNAIQNGHTAGQISCESNPTDSSKLPAKHKNINKKYKYAIQGRQGNNTQNSNVGQPTRRPDEAKSETRSHGMTKTVSREKNPQPKRIAMERKIVRDPDHVHFLFRDK